MATEAVNASALESWDDEFPIAGMTKAKSRVRPPRVAESPVQFECKVHSIIRIPGNSLVGHSDVVVGLVVGIHVKMSTSPKTGQVSFLYRNLKAAALIQVLLAVWRAPIARLGYSQGYSQYTHIEKVFDMTIPIMPDDTVSLGMLGCDMQVHHEKGANKEAKGKEEVVARSPRN